MANNDQWQVVEGPDGQEYEFPVSMSDGDIAKVMAREYPSQGEGAQEYQDYGLEPSQARTGNPEPMTADMAQRVERVKGKSSREVYGHGFKDNLLGAVEAFEDGITLDTADELNAAFSTLIPIDRVLDPSGKTEAKFGDFSGNLEKVREQRERVKLRSSPLVRQPAESLGTLAAGGPALAKMGAVKGGAIAGGVYGAGSSEGDIKERVRDGSKGAAFGAAGGFVLNKVVSRLQSGGKFEEAERRALDVVFEAAKKKGIKRAAVIKDLQSSTDDGRMVFERLGLIDEARGFSANITDETQGVIQKLASEKAGQKSKLVTDAKEALGDTKFEAAEDVINTNFKKASQKYEEVFSQPLEMTPKLKSIMANPFVKNASKSANKIAKSEQQLTGKPPNRAKHLQLTKEALDDKISLLYRKGKNKEAGAVSNVRNALLDEMDAALPGFSDVRKTWGGEARNKGALEEGRKFFTKVPRDIKREVGKMSESEKQYHFVGVMDAIGRKINKKVDGADTTRIINDEVREQIRALLPPEKAERFLSRFESEAGRRRVLNAVDPSVNSQTQPRQEAAKAAREMTLTGPQKFTGGAADALSQPIHQPGRVMRWLGRNLKKEDPDVMAAVTRMLYSEPKEFTQVYSNLNSKQRQSVDYYFSRLFPKTAGVATVSAVKPEKPRIQ